MNSRDAGSDPLPESAELIEALGRYRDGLAARIREANGMTEREVLATGEALRLIVDEARSFAQGSQQTLERIARAPRISIWSPTRSLKPLHRSGSRAKCVLQPSRSGSRNLTRDGPTHCVSASNASTGEQLFGFDGYAARR